MALRKKKQTNTGGHLQQVQVGLGEAIQRLVAVEFRYRQGVHAAPEELLQERDMLTTALNQYELDLGFDCDFDGTPDTLAIFKESATTSCCRILPTDTSRRSPQAPSKEPESKKRWGGLFGGGGGG
jgi:hypothetical protein